LQYALAPDARDDKQTKETNKHDRNYEGENVEKEVFMKLKQCFGEESELKNVSIFSGWKDEGILEKSVTREFDFIIVSGDAKKVFLIEVKRKNDGKNTRLKKATLQLCKGYHFLRETIPFSKGWKFVSVVYLKYNDSNTKSDFILGPNSSFSDFFEKHLKYSLESADHGDSSNKVTCILKILF